MNRVQQNLAATLLPVHLGRQTETAGWEGLVSLLTTGITGYTAIRQTEEQRKAVEVMADIERMKLAQAAAETPQAKMSAFLRQYWPWLLGGTAGLITLALVFRKRR